MRDTLGTAQDNPVTVANSIDAVKAYFDLIDRDGDKFLSTKEVGTGARAIAFLSEQERRAIEAFEPAIQAAQKLVNDEYGFENNGVSEADVRALDKELLSYPDIKSSIEEVLPGQDVRNKRTFGALLNSKFDLIDVDDDGTLSKFEIQHFGTLPMNTESERVMAKVLVDHYDEFKSITNEDGLKKRSVQGPFLESWEGNKNITRHDVDTFDNLLARSENFEKYIKRQRLKEFGTGFGGALIYGGLTTLSGIVTVGDPEPVSKTIMGVVTTSLAGVTAAHFYHAVHGETRTIRDQYNDRQQMLGSWKFFNKS